MATTEEIEQYIVDTQALIYAFRMQRGEVSDAVASLMQKQHDNYKSLWKSFNKLSDEYTKLNNQYQNFLLTHSARLD